MNGMIAWFARNHVPANLLMCLILVGGTVSLLSIKQEIVGLHVAVKDMPAVGMAQPRGRLHNVTDDMLARKRSIVLA